MTSGPENGPLLDSAAPVGGKLLLPTSLIPHRPDLPTLRLRAEAFHLLRDFFHARGVLEVETPILSRGISLDCHIDPFSSEFHLNGYPRTGRDGGGNLFYLQSSPEPHMKRLLCRGFPDLYQVSKSFRNGESGRLHNPEFTMVEWYRRGYTLADLMEEVESLCHLLLGPMPVHRKTYRQAFLAALELDPVEMSREDLLNAPQTKAIVPVGIDLPTKADVLDFLMAHAVEPSFDSGTLVFVSGFPVEQAAQAQVDPEDSRLAMRFEVYGGGMELGNGYLELLDAKVYAERFAEENAKRENMGKPELPVDIALLNDLHLGLPPCAGVAMGWDRLIMLRAGKTDIQSVLSFPWETC